MKYTLDLATNLIGYLVQHDWKAALEASKELIKPLKTYDKVC